jgi:hypothetical protein
LDKESSRTTALLFDLSQGRHCAAPQDAGSFGLSDFEDSHDVANAELPVVEEQPEHLKPRFIGKDFKEPGGFSHGNLLFCIHISGLTNAVKRYLAIDRGPN